MIFVKVIVLLVILAIIWKWRRMKRCPTCGYRIGLHPCYSCGPKIKPYFDPQTGKQLRSTADREPDSWA